MSIESAMLLVACLLGANVLLLLVGIFMAIRDKWNEW